MKERVWWLWRCITGHLFLHHMWRCCLKWSPFTGWSIWSDLSVAHYACGLVWTRYWSYMHIWEGSISPAENIFVQLVTVNNSSSPRTPRDSLIIDAAELQSCKSGLQHMLFLQIVISIFKVKQARVGAEENTLQSPRLFHALDLEYMMSITS